MGQERLETGVWKRWALTALGISVAMTLSQLVVREAFHGDVEHPPLYLLVGVILLFCIYYSTFAFAELWSRHRGRSSLRVESLLPTMPTLVWVQSALVEADRDCVIESCHGNGLRVFASDRWNRWTSRNFQLTIDRTDDGCRAVVMSEIPPRFVDRGKTESLVASVQAGIRWRCEEALGV